MEAKIAVSVEWFTQINHRISGNLRDRALRFKTEVDVSMEILISRRRQKEITQCKFFLFLISNKSIFDIALITTLRQERGSLRVVLDRVLKGIRPLFLSRGSSSNSNTDLSNSSKCRAVTVLIKVTTQRSL